MSKKFRCICMLMVTVISSFVGAVSGSVYHADAAEVNIVEPLQIDDKNLLVNDYIKVIDNQFVLDQQAFNDARFTPLFLEEAKSILAGNNKIILEENLTIDPATKVATYSVPKQSR